GAPWGTCVGALARAPLPLPFPLVAPATLALALPFALLVLPIFDTTAAIVRRKLTGRSICTTDRGHLHHCLLRRGFSTAGVLWIVGTFCVLACAGALASQAFDNEWIALLTAATVIATLITTRLFGHAEAMLVKGRIL